MKTVIPENPSIGICIATHGSVPYVHLGLEALRRYEPGMPVLVHDDSSNEQEQLRALCRDYGADFTSTHFRMIPTVGDLCAFAAALRWGQERELEIVVKCSRRMILNRRWAEGLGELAHNSQYATYTGACAHYGFGFRSELVGMHVPSYVASGAYDEMAETARRNQLYDSLPEAWYHHRARDVHRFVHPPHNEASHADDNSHPDVDYVVRGERFYPRPDSYDGFAIWPLMGLARHQRVPGVLWHDSHGPEEYHALSQKFGLPYSVADFITIPGE